MAEKTVPRTATPGRIVAHRGASRVAPENTAAAFRGAAAQGARWIEFDVSALGDGLAVVHHDARWGRSVAGRGRLSAARAADLAGLDAGSWFGPAFAGEPVPRLDETLELMAGLGLSANLEMKAHGWEAEALAAAVARALAAHPWTRERVLVSSFDHASLHHLRALMPDQPIALLWDRPPRRWADAVHALRAAAVHCDWRRLRPVLLEEAAAHRIEVRVYTCNDPDRLAPFRAGLTGVITDHPPLFLDRPDWADWAAPDRQAPG